MKPKEFVTTSAGMKVMKQFYMSRTFWHKGWVWIWSVVEGYALASEHNTGDSKNMGGNYYRGKYQLEHDKQIKEKYDQATKEENLLLTKEGVVIEDITEESRLLLKETAKLKPSD